MTEPTVMPGPMATTEPATIEGGCACGAIRYRIVDEKPRECGYCHCRICQRTSGAPVVVFATVGLGAFEIVKGSPRVYPSTTFGERWFCETCGSLLAMRVTDEPDTIDVTVASFDDPAPHAPGFHIWLQSRIPWFETTDHLPRFPAKRPG